jgi:hypothetical protein
MFYQILKGVYASNLFETCFMFAVVFTPIQFPDQKS